MVIKHSHLLCFVGKTDGLQLQPQHSGAQLTVNTTALRLRMFVDSKSLQDPAGVSRSQAVS